jgi:hypothetical protein
MNDKTIKQAVVTDQTSIDTSQVVELIALFNSDGTQVDLDALQVQDGDNILLTGYVPVTGDILATDTLNEAIAKFEARIEALETP